MKRLYLKFRFWDTQNNTFVEDYNYCGPVDKLFCEQEFDIIIPQQCTGIKDVHGLYIYEGDIIKFKIEGKEYIGTIQRDCFMQCNLDVVVNESTSVLTPVQVFNLSTLKDATIISHIYKA